MISGSREHITPGLAGLCVWFLALWLTGSAQAAQFTVNVVDGDGNPVQGFKYLLQEDRTFPVDPDNPPTREQMLSFGFHASNHPIARRRGDHNGGAYSAGDGIQGNTDAASVNLTRVRPGRYFLSVLPYSGYAMGGAPVTVLPNAQDPDQVLDDVTVTVNAHPIPTAQITVFLFEDTWPLNGVPDLPEEDNPGSDGHAVDWTQFSIVLEEPAGLYGQNGGQVIQDAFGNPLGTAYPPGDPNPYTVPDGAGGTCPATGPGGVCADGTLHPDGNGILTVKNLPPGKYGIIVVPPLDSPPWQQTSTIEGSPVIDAWVKANEPPFFVEFGLPGPHVFVGFTQEANHLPNGGGVTVTGTVTNMHMSRPPATTFHSGQPFPGCWIALNEGGAAPGRMLYAAPCDGDSNFAIPNVPLGESYELKVFDTNLDVVIATLPLTVDAGGGCNGGAGCALGDVPVFNWFNRLETGIFNDPNQNGFWDAGELPIGPEAGPVGIRWRNGTVYQEFPTDGEGLAPFDEVFPFFHWLVAEVGFGNKKATGATFVVDAGGETLGDVLNPQPQTCSQEDIDDGVDNCAGGAAGLTPRINPNTGDDLSRTETGPVLTQAFQGFLGQTSTMNFGKADYLTTLLQFPPPPPPASPMIFVGENGGISGMVHYATTRAEDDPRFAAPETWEPGVPRVQVAMYADGDIDCSPGIGAPWPTDACDINWDGIAEGGSPVRDTNDGVIDDVNGDGVVTLADVDNYPLGWGDPDCVNSPAIPGNECNRGDEDVDRNDDGVFDYGDALAVGWSDSWDDSLPTNCGGDNNIDIDGGGITVAEQRRCFDGLRNFNQVRPGVFDGGWAFDAYHLSHLPAAIADKLAAFYAATRAKPFPPLDPRSAHFATLGEALPEEWMLPADYIVEAATPPGYKLVKEEDKNVDFGDDYVPSTQALDVPCVGDPRVVPPLLSFATRDGSGAAGMLSPGLDNSGGDFDAPFAGESRPLCDRKAVLLSAGQNAAANFFVMTDVPIAGNVTGFVLNDLANEFNPNTPSFGEKYAPPFIPVAFYDWAGNPVSRVYADEFGRYDLVVPSTYSVNLPFPSGMSPNMMVSCMNDAGPIPNPESAGNPDAPAFILDPRFDPQFSQFCYTFQYMPGAATYLDTPVVAIAGFTNPVTEPVDCERADRTPMISRVQRRANSSPSGRADGPFIVSDFDQEIRIRSMGGNVKVPNPNWDGIDPNTKEITRNYNFGGTNNPGNVKLVDADGVVVADLNGLDGQAGLLELVEWRGRRIDVRIPAEAVDAGEYQVVVTRVGGVPVPVDSPLGVTLTVGICQGGNPNGATCAGTEHGVRPAPQGFGPYYDVHRVSANGSIQDAIDAASPGDLILVEPGVYDELLVMWKPVKLQGWGAGDVILNARQVPTEKMNDWRNRVQDLVAQGLIDLLPGQELDTTGFPALGAPLFPTEEGAGIFVAGKNAFPNWFRGLPNRGARIDGFTVVGATQGGAIVLNGYTGHMNIGNNRLVANAGFYGGGIRSGHPALSHEEPDTGLLVYDDAWNDNLRIHHNHIVKNGGINSAGVGGGIALHTGTDNYEVQQNWVCGNFSAGSGAGVGHLGFSDRGLIEDNVIAFNESFSQASTEHGGGIYIGGQPGLQPIAEGTGAGLTVSPGTGTVTIDANRVHGNLAGVGDGGGIRIENVNGRDVAASPDNQGPWDDVWVYNNMITNNVAGLAAGGISVENALSVTIRQNTIANNDSTSTAALGFGNPNLTLPLPAGVVARVHSGDMGLLLQETSVTDPDLLAFSDLSPVFGANVIWQNRSFYWSNQDDPATTDVIEVGLCPAVPGAPVPCDLNAALPADPATYTEDLGVLNGVVRPAGLQLDPRRSLLTDITDYAGFGNFSADPDFVMPEHNGARDNLAQAEFTTLQTAAAFDEGGNFIQVTFGPLTLDAFDYHLNAASPAIFANAPSVNNPVAGGLPLLHQDIDNDIRPNAIYGFNGDADLGADQYATP